MPLPTRTRSPISNRCGGSAVHSSAAATSVDTRVAFLLPDRLERFGDAPVDLEERVEIRDPKKTCNPPARIDENELAVLRFHAVQCAHQDSDGGGIQILEVGQVEDHGTRPLVRRALESSLELMNALARLRQANDLESVDTREKSASADGCVAALEQQRRLGQHLREERRADGAPAHGRAAVGSQPRRDASLPEIRARRREDGVHETERIGMRQLRRRSHQAIFLCSMKSTSALTEAKALTPTSSSSTLIPNSCSSPSTSSRASIESSPSPSPKSGASFWIVVGSMSSFRRRTINSFTRGARFSLGIGSPREKL